MSPENEASPQHYTTIHTTKSFSHAHWDLQPSKPCCGAEERQLLCSWYKWWHLSCGSTEGDRNQETVWEKEKKKKWWNFRDGLLAKQFVINLSVKTDGKPQGSGSAKTLYRRIFRNTVFCYYAGKPLLHTITMTVVVFDIQNRSLVLHHWGQKKLFQWLSAATNRREIIWFECRQEESIIPQNPWF